MKDKKSLHLHALCQMASADDHDHEYDLIIPPIAILAQAGLAETGPINFLVQVQAWFHPRSLHLPDFLLFFRLELATMARFGGGLLDLPHYGL